jgi:putative salt-induced outer membrane protein YdiY
VIFPRILRPFVLLLSLAASLGLADTIELDNGSRLVGVVAAVRNGKVDFQTDFAGKVSIPMGRIVALQTDSPLRVAVAEHGEAVGTLSIAGDRIEVRDPAKPLTAATAELLAAGPADQPLTVGPPPPAAPRWKYESSVSYRVKSGNTDNSRLHFGAAAEKKWAKEKVKLYAAWAHGEDNNKVTEDETIGGADFERQLNTHFLWYARTDVEQDDIEEISLRATVAAGFGWYAMRSETHELRLRSGLQYLRESYDNDEPEDNSLGLELGLRHSWQLAPWGKLVNEIVYSSSFDDWSDYRVVHESSLDIPLANSRFWLLRLGLSHEYNNIVAADIDELDTCYFLRLVFKWK